jgi:carboxypeptidase PM20D1
MIGIWIFALVAIFLAIILARALAFKPKQDPAPVPSEVKLDEDRVAGDMQAIIRMKTVSYLDKSLEDEKVFEEFPLLLKKLYPRLHEKLEQERIGGRGILYRWPGKKSDKPGVLMAHYDVVPVQEATWDKPPFSAVIEDGILWGRGTLDTKCTLLGVMEAAEKLVSEGFVPENDLYLAFAGDEEIFGQGAPGIVAELKRRNVTPAFVLDEGGAVVDNVFPGVKEPCALIGLGEKGILNITLEAVSSGGHASTPPPHTAVGVVAKAVTRAENRPFRFQLTPAVIKMFDTLGRRSSFIFRIIFANLWCFKPVLNVMCKKKGGEMNALVRTTCAFTLMSGSPAHNVLPPKATVGANLRLMGSDTMESARAYVEKAVHDSGVSVTIANGTNPSPCSPAEGEAWERLKTVIGQTWPGAVVSPYLMVAASDSRHYAAISKYVYRFSPMAMTAEERRTIHANNERIELKKLYELVRFYVRLMKLM